MTRPDGGSAREVVSCGAVLFRQETQPVYLLLRYTARHWDFPKGHQEPGETEEETTRREIQEETGITELEFVPGFRRSIRYGYAGKDGRVRKTVHFRLAQTSAPRDAVRLSHEHVAYAWLDYAAARSRLTFANARTVVDAAHAHLGARAADAPGPG